MATLKKETFPSDKDGQDLLKKVQLALTHLAVTGGSKSGDYLTAPIMLDAGRDGLVENFQDIWKNCVIEYNSKQAGAEILQGTTIQVGEFFLRRESTIIDLEKVILHEFLHVALTPSGVGGETGYEYDHTRINQVIRDNLKYPGKPNPAFPDEE